MDPSTVCFGDADPAQRECNEAHGTGHIEDVNGDGRPDLLLHYETSQTGIDPGDTGLPDRRDFRRASRWKAAMRSRRSEK